MKNVNLYYGMSGTFKSFIMNHSRYLYNINIKGEDEVLKMYSSIKDWKSLYKDSCDSFGVMDINSNLNFGYIHLIRLKDFIDYFNKGDYKALFIERGITDFIFYNLKCRGDINNLSDKYEDSINKLVDYELDILSKVNDGDICLKKNLNIQSDRKFIEEKVLNETSRSDCFRNVDTYLKDQENYVNFTERFNKIDVHNRYCDSYEYLKKVNKTLGLE